MNFLPHYEIKDKHALLSPSNYHWLNYDEEKLKKFSVAMKAKMLGTKKHSFVADAIDMKIKINSGDKTLDTYVSDCIDMNMNTEVGLKYDSNCFGTADAIYADEYENKLYIFDLKTGMIKASMKQLMIYAALFFLEYDYDPEDWYVELRIYQNLEENDINKHIPSPEEIYVIMDKITVSSEIINTRSR